MSFKIFKKMWADQSAQPFLFHKNVTKPSQWRSGWHMSYTHKKTPSSINHCWPFLENSLAVTHLLKFSHQSISPASPFSETHHVSLVPYLLLWYGHILIKHPRNPPINQIRLETLLCKCLWPGNLKIKIMSHKCRTHVIPRNYSRALGRILKSDIYIYTVWREPLKYCHAALPVLVKKR